MSKIKVRYTWLWHTVVDLEWVETIVKEWEIVEILNDKETKQLFLSNYFVEVWGKDIKLIQESIDLIKKELKAEENNFKITEAWIKEKAEEEIKLFKTKSEERKNCILFKIKWLEEEIEIQNKDKEFLLKKIKDDDEERKRILKEEEAETRLKAMNSKTKK